MSARMMDLKVQYLVTPVSSSRPSIMALRRYFERLCRQEVDLGYWAEVGYIVTVKTKYAEGFVFSHGLQQPSIEKYHMVEGHLVQVHLVVPDVYGCEVSVWKGHLELNIGQEAMIALTHETHWRDQLLNSALCSKLDAVSVRCVSTGYIVISCVSLKSLFFTWVWELFVLDRLIEELSPYRGLFPSDQLPLRNRCLDTCGSWSTQSESCSAARYCFNDTRIRTDEMAYGVLSQEAFLRKIQTVHPEVRVTCDRSQLTVALTGKDEAVKNATKPVLKYAEDLVSDTMPLTVVETLMMKKADSQVWFQQCLDCKNILCAWKLLPFNTQDGSVLSFTAQEYAIQDFKHIFHSSFQTKEIKLGRNHIAQMQSDLGKRFQDELEKAQESSITPVMRVKENEIILCDIASNIHYTYDAVLEFISRSQDEPREDFSQDVINIMDLEPWQVNFLANDQVKNQLPQCLQQAMAVMADQNTVQIRAPVHRVKKYVSDVRSYVSHLSQQRIELTVASAQLLQASDSQLRIQKALEEKNVMCDWQMEKGQLVVRAQDSDMDQLCEIFLKEVETNRLASQATQNAGKGPEMSPGLVKKSQQREFTGHQSASGLFRGEEQTGSDIGPLGEDGQTEGNNTGAKPKQKLASIKNQCYRKMLIAKRKTRRPVTQTQLTQNEHREEQIPQMKVKADGKQNEGLSTESMPHVAEMGLKNEHDPARTREHQTDEQQTGNSERPVVVQMLWSPQGRREEESNSTDDYKSLPENSVSDLDDETERKETSEASDGDSSLTLLKAVLDSQEERSDNTALTCDPCPHPDLPPWREQVPSQLNTCVFSTQSSFGEESRLGIPDDVKTQESAVSDTDVQSTHGSDISASLSTPDSDVTAALSARGSTVSATRSSHGSDVTSILSTTDSSFSASSSSYDPRLFDTGGERHIRKHLVSHRNEYNVSTNPASSYIYPMLPNVYEPILQNPSPPVGPSNMTDIPSFPSTRSSTPSVGQEDEQERIRQLPSGFRGWAFSAQSYAGLQTAQSYHHRTIPEARDPWAPYDTTATHPLNATWGPHLGNSPAENERNASVHSSAPVWPGHSQTSGSGNPASRNMNSATAAYGAGANPYPSTLPTQGPPEHQNSHCGTSSGRQRQQQQPAHPTAATSQAERSRSTSQLGCERCHLSTLHRQQEQLYQGGCIYEELLCVVLSKLDHPEHGRLWREDTRGRSRPRGASISSENGGEPREGWMERQEACFQHLAQQVNGVMQMVSQLQLQQPGNTYTLDVCNIQNPSDTETASSMSSLSVSQRLPQQRQQQQQQQQQQEESVLSSEYFCTLV